MAHKLLKYLGIKKTNGGSRMKRICTIVLECMILISFCYLTPPNAIGGAIEYDVTDSAEITRSPIIRGC